MDYFDEKEKEAIFEDILEEISNGRSIRKVLKDPGMPGTLSFYQWLKARPDWQERYTLANEARQELLFDSMWDIAQNTELGEEITTSLKDTKMVVKDMTQHRALKINTLQWMLSRMNPTKYGNKIEVDEKRETKLEPLEFTIIRKANSE